MPKKKKPFKEWTFTVEELRHYQKAPAKCPCDACRRIHEYYGITQDFIEWEDKFEKEIGWKPDAEESKESAD